MFVFTALEYLPIQVFELQLCLLIEFRFQVRTLDVHFNFLGNSTTNILKLVIRY